MLHFIVLAIVFLVINFSFYIAIGELSEYYYKKTNYKKKFKYFWDYKFKQFKFISSKVGDSDYSHLERSRTVSLMFNHILNRYDNVPYIVEKYKHSDIKKDVEFFTLRESFEKRVKLNKLEINVLIRFIMLAVLIFLLLNSPYPKTFLIMTIILNIFAAYVCSDTEESGFYPGHLRSTIKYIITYKVFRKKELKNMTEEEKTDLLFAGLDETARYIVHSNVVRIATDKEPLYIYKTANIISNAYGYALALKGEENKEKYNDFLGQVQQPVNELSEMFMHLFSLPLDEIFIDKEALFQSALENAELIKDVHNSFTNVKEEKAFKTAPKKIKNDSSLTEEEVLANLRLEDTRNNLKKWE